mgnify:CR=1 FL=1
MRKDDMFKRQAAQRLTALVREIRRVTTHEIANSIGRT